MSFALTWKVVLCRSFLFARRVEVVYVREVGGVVVEEVRAPGCAIRRLRWVDRARCGLQPLVELVYCRDHQLIAVVVVLDVQLNQNRAISKF